MAQERFDVVIPAGGEIDGEYASRAGTRIRALAPIGKSRRPVLQIVIDGLRASGKTGTIIVTGPEELRGHIDGVDVWLPEGLPDAPGISAGPANILRGLRELPPEQPALVCTSDLPFLTAESVAAFAGRIDPKYAVTGGLVRASAYGSRFGDAPPSEYVTLRETGPVTMGGLFAVRPDALLGNMDRVMSAFTARKSQWKMIRLLGSKLIFQFVTRTLSLKSICGRVEDLLACPVGIIDDALPETAFDIDTAQDYIYADSRA